MFRNISNTFQEFFFVILFGSFRRFLFCIQYSLRASTFDLLSSPRVTQITMHFEFHSFRRLVCVVLSPISPFPYAKQMISIIHSENESETSLIPFSFAIFQNSTKNESGEELMFVMSLQSFQVLRLHQDNNTTPE